jgi:hypothetical protein
MSVLPTVRSGRSAIYPVSRADSFDTTIIPHWDGSEQRWMSRNVLGNFVLAYTNINATDRSALETFTATVIGSNNSAWQFTLANVSTWGSCQFIDNSFEFTETAPGRYSGQIRFKQTAVSGLNPGGTLTANPNPIVGVSGAVATTISWDAPSTTSIQVRLDSPTGTLFASGGSTGSLATGTWVTDGQQFWLKDVINGFTLSYLEARVYSSATVGAINASGICFPMFDIGINQQFPITRGRRFFNSVTRMKCGTSWSMPFWGAGLANFPGTGLRYWQWPLVLTDMQLFQLETFFVWACGNYRTFTFVDPDDNTQHTSVRFDMDALEIRHSLPNQSNVTVKLIETFLGRCSRIDGICSCRSISGCPAN